jgi:hypothetical protein
MSREVKVLLVFCEGSHDVAFVSQVMKSFFNFNRVTWKFSQYPAPFNELFRVSVEQHAAQDLSLDMAHKFFLPDQVLESESQVVLLFNSGGKSQSDKVKDLLSNFLPLLENAKTFPGDAVAIVSEARYLFLYDADDLGVDNTRIEIRKAFREIEGNLWMTEQWAVHQNNPFAAMMGEKSIYIWGDTIEKGTLEDLLFPLFKQDNLELFSKAETTIDEFFSWDTANDNLKIAVAEDARRKKAIITFAGQRKKPGGSMSVILDQAKLITKETLINDPNSLAFAKFVAEFAEFEDIVQELSQ